MIDLGSIIVVWPKAGGIGRLCVVSGFEDEYDSEEIEVMMVNAWTELATEVDAVLAPEQTGLNYEVVVHTRYVTWIKPINVKIVGKVDDATVRQLVRMYYLDDPPGVTLQRGMPLQPEGIDPRWPALKALSVEFDRLRATK